MGCVIPRYAPAGIPEIPHLCRRRRPIDDAGLDLTHGPSARRPGPHENFDARSRQVDGSADAGPSARLDGRDKLNL